MRRTFVAHAVGEGVVHLLEVVDVADHEGERVLVTAGFGEHAHGLLVEVAPVVELREAVADAELLQLLGLLPNLSGGGGEVVVGSREIAAHAVEGLREDADLVHPAHRHILPELSATHGLGGVGDFPQAGA